MAKSRLITGNSIEVLKTFVENSVDSVVCDPPYALPGGFMGAKWDNFDNRNFQEWTQQWAVEVLRVLKPGGFLLSFSGAKTYHRMACGVEDAGFKLTDQIM